MVYGVLALCIVNLLLEIGTFAYVFRRRSQLSSFLAGQGATNNAVLEHLNAKDNATKALIISVVKECLRQTRTTLEEVRGAVDRGISDAASKAAEVAAGSTIDSAKLKVIPPQS